MQNSKYSTILIDDERPALEVLKYLVNRHCPELSISKLFLDPLAAQSYIRKHQPDLAFIDIKMRDINGLEVIRELESVNTEFIFTTAFSKYALDAWNTKAIGYLLKPTEPKDLVQAVQKFVALKENKGSKPSSKSIKLGSETIQSDSVYMVEAKGSYAKLFFVDGKEKVLSKNLKTIEEALPNDVFYRVHRSVIVNASSVKEIDKKNRKITFKNGMETEISERRLSLFLEFLAERQ